MAVKNLPQLGWTRGNVAATILLVNQQQRDQIAGRVRAEMERIGLTNTRLARNANLSEKTVSRLINGKLNPRYDTLERVAQALGMTEQELRGVQPPPLGLAAEAPNPGEQLAELQETVSRLDQQIQQLRGELAIRDLEVRRLLEAAAAPIPASPLQQQR